jgi:hypothetical protein
MSASTLLPTTANGSGLTFTLSGCTGAPQDVKIAKAITDAKSFNVFFILVIFIVLN